LLLLLLLEIGFGAVTAGRNTASKLPDHDSTD
jgi:hypothetical protein